MNQLQPYEQTIATKLVELPLPDMADAIWADIAAQLDGDLPPDGEAPTPGNNPSGGTSWAKGITLAVGTVGIALVAYWLIRLNQPTAAPTPTNPQPAEQKIPQTDTALQTQRIRRVNPPAVEEPPIQTLAPNTPTISTNRIFQPIAVDSVLLQPTSPPTSQPDSAVAPITAPVLVLPPPGKKQRGTQGIKDSDYKFVRGKDST